MLQAWVVNLLFCCLVILLGNISFWQHAIVAYPVSATNIQFLCGMALLILSVYYAFLTLLSFRYILKPLLITLLIFTALSAYAMDTFGYVISLSTFQNLFATDSREIYDLLGLKLLAYMTGLALLPCLLVFLAKIKYPSYKKQLVHILIAVLLIVGNLIMFKRSYTSFLRNHKHVRYYLNPVRPVYALVKFSLVLSDIYGSSTTDFQIIDPQPVLAANTGKPRLIVLVIGEADRAANQYLNGYARQTNPLLSARDDIYNFSQVYSCGTETTVSVPCMFSPFKRVDFTNAKGRYTENLLDLLQKSSVQVLWRDNDSGCKNVCDRVPLDDFNDAKITPFCNDFECHDEVLLHQLNAYIESNIGDKIIVLHKKGNHGPAYYKRYPAQFEVFTPTCKSNELQDCSDPEIVNAYDNIILYTDYFLDKVIKQLESYSQQYQSAMIYVSDHGESLGEHNLYLHAMPYMIAPKEQIHVPFVFWASKDFSVNRDKIKQIQQQEFSHDNLFHSVLGLFKVQTPVYDDKLDMFAG